MSDTFKLMYDNNTHTLETIEEQTNKDQEKQLYVQGIFGQAGKKNKNNRIYDPEEMRVDLERYTKEFINEGRAYNELNHPSTPDVDLERACDRTVKLWMENDGTIYGKALILPTPMGRIQKGLIDGGGKIGKSSRALGQISESTARDGSTANYVQGVRLVCFDSVQDPSVGSAIVDPLLEQREWIIGEDGGFLAKPFENLEKTLHDLPVAHKEEYIIEGFLNFLKEIRSK